MLIVILFVEKAIVYLSLQNNEVADRTMIHGKDIEGDGLDSVCSGQPKSDKSFYK